MKKLFVLASALLFAFSPLALAADEAQTKLAGELSKTVGVKAMLEEIKRRTDAVVEQQVGQVDQQMSRAIPEMSKEQTAEIQQLFSDFMVRLKSSWDEKEAEAVYAKTLAELLTADQLKAAVDHYKTAQGQAELKAINDASMKMNDYITQAFQKSGAEQFNDLMGKVRAIAMKGKTAPRPPAEKEGEKK